jgi:hypothetical protein
MSHWLIIGGGPLAQEHAKGVQADKIVGCNRAIEFAKLDLYWLSDPVAIARYRYHWRRFTGEIVSNADLGQPATPFPYMDKGPVYHGRCSGVLCCRVAISRGATKLTLVGFQGYKASDKYEDVDGKPVAPRGDQAVKVNAAQAIAFADIAAKHPDLSVEVYGPTEISFPASWRIV